MANRFTRVTPLQPKVQPFQLPVKELSLAFQAEQARFDEGEAISNKLLDLSIQALPSQRARANTILSDIDSEVNQIIDDFDGNFARGNKRLKNLERQVNKIFGHGGEANTIESNFVNFHGFAKDLNSRLEKGDINAAQVVGGKNFALNQFNQAPDQDQVTGAFKTITPFLPSVANQVNVGEKAFEIGEKVVPKILKQMKVVKDPQTKGFYTMVGQKRTYLPANFIENIITSQLVKDPETMQFLQQMGTFSGASPQDALNIAMQGISRHAKDAALALERNDIENDLKLQQDPVFMENMRHANRMAAIRYRHNLSKELSRDQAALNMQTRFSRNTATGLGDKFRINTNIFGRVNSVGEEDRTVLKSFKESLSDIASGKSPFRSLSGKSLEGDLQEFINNGTTNNVAFDLTLRTMSRQKGTTPQQILNSIKGDSRASKKFNQEMADLSNIIADSMSQYQSIDINPGSKAQLAAKKNLIDSGLWKDHSFTRRS
jgi:hypothetical protein